MAILTAVIVPAKVLKDGRHKIRIGVAHNSETRYIVTDIVIDSIKEWRNGAVVKRPDANFLNTKLRKYLQEYQSKIDALEGASALTCAELINYIKNSSKYEKITLQGLFEETIKCLKSKSSTIEVYESHWRRITRFMDPDMVAERLKASDVMLLEKGMAKRGLKNSTINITIMFLKTVINFGLKNGVLNYKINPFINLKVPKAEIREAWLSVDDIKKIRDVSLKKGQHKEVRDIFMLSYYLGGINIADIIRLDFSSGLDVIKYERQKTSGKAKPNKYVEFSIPKEAKEIIMRYLRPNGKLAFKSPLNRLSHYMNYHIKSVAKAAKIKSYVIYYSARKSFSQHAYELGIRDSVIDYILGHTLAKGGSCLYAYRRVTPEIASEALRKVLDNLK